MLKIIFAGTPDFAAHHLITLIKSNYQIISVLTKPDSKMYQRNKNILSPVKVIAQKYNITVHQPHILDHKIEILLNNLKADIMIVVAYGIKITSNIINMFPLGCINIHASILPRWRGPSPIQYAILTGDKKTGITIIKMDSSIDTGDIIHIETCPISNTDNTKTLTKKLIHISTKTILFVLKNIKNKNVNYLKQNNLNATYSKKIHKQDGKINWNKTAIQINRMIRAYCLWPSSYFNINENRIKILSSEIKKQPTNQKHNIGEIISITTKGINVQTKKDILKIKKIQFPGKNVITSNDIINSKITYFKPGLILQ
ncbi:MAG: methionyl-tRNA formyltransferase [Buchnera aphidicola (Eriosoma harunire)]